MNALDDVALVAAGIGGGLTGSVAGLASLVSYPVLLAVGLPPVTANVSNTVSLVFSTVGSVWGSRPELAGQQARFRRLGPVVLAGLAGAVLLLATPSPVFARLVPWLIGLAAIAIVAPRPAGRPVPAEGAPPTAALIVGALLTATYGGYFGAAAGVILLALLLHGTGEPLARSNALKNLLLGLANAAASIVFVVAGPVRWSVVAPLAAGFLVGGRLGPIVVRRAPVGPLRVLIAGAGLGLAVHLGLDAYGIG